MVNLTLQVLQYNVEAGTWSEMGKLKRGRYAHAVVEANLGAVFAASGKINSIFKKEKFSSPIPLYSKHQLQNSY